MLVSAKWTRLGMEDIAGAGGGTSTERAYKYMAAAVSVW
jgi:hypothetical protein